MGSTSSNNALISDIRSHAAEPVSRSELSVIELGSMEAFAKIAVEWDRLVAACATPNVFLTSDWLVTWWRHYGTDRSWQVLLVRDKKGHLIGGLPLYGESRLLFGRSYRLLRFIGTQPESPDNLDVVTEESTRIAVANALSNWINTAGKQRYDILMLSNLAKDSVLIEGLDSGAVTKSDEIKVTPLFQCPYLSLPSSFDTYVSSLSKNMRYNLRRRTRQVLNLPGGIEIAYVDSATGLPAAMGDLFRLHTLRRAARGGETRFTMKARQEFHRNLAATFLKQGRLRLLLLKANSQTIAAVYCFKYVSKTFYFQSGFDPRWSKYSVGMVLMGQCIEMAIRDGCKEFDFLRGDEDYKFQWTTEVRQTVEVRCPLTARGQNVLRVLEGHAHIKRLLRRFLPEVARQGRKQWMKAWTYDSQKKR
jgi:CelD/BcsL family acetyltransferase involved in cellulose biosynthesis